MIRVDVQLDDLKAIVSVLELLELKEVTLKKQENLETRWIVVEDKEEIVNFLSNAWIYCEKESNNALHS